MAMAKEIMGVSLIDRSSFLTKQNKFLVNPFALPLEKRRAVPLRKVVRGPVAAISEDLVKKALPLPVPSDKTEKFKVRAVVTVRNKSKEDLKDSIVKHLDAFTDKIGRNVVLQLVSTEIDPSKPIFFLYFCVRIRQNIYLFFSVLSPFVSDFGTKKSLSHVGFPLLGPQICHQYSLN
jgi:hypothetical protein